MDVPVSASEVGAARSGIPLSPPTRSLFTIASVGLLLAVVAIVLASQQPQLGIRLESAPGGGDAPPQVEQTLFGPSPMVHAGTRVLWLQAPGQQPIQLRSDDLTPEPSRTFTNYKAFRAFLVRQERLHRLLRAGGVYAGLGNGQRVLLPVAQGRALGSLGWKFWIQIVSALGALLIGCGIWVFRPAESAARYSAIIGASVLLMDLPAVVYSTRMLALPGPMFAALISINHLASLVCAASVIGILWHYPRRFAAWNIGPWALLVAVCWWAVEQLEVSPIGMASTDYAEVACYLLAFGLAVVQWWRVRHDPLERAAFEWFMLAGLVGVGVLLVAIIMPGWFGIRTGWLQAYVCGLFLLIQAGIALGIARYRLYDVERWWLQALGFVAGGLTVVVLDLVLVSVLPLDGSGALLLSLALSGWLYFPMRQLVAGWLPMWRQRPGRDMFSRMLPELLGSQRSISQLLPDALSALFMPLDIQPSPDPIKSPKLHEHGSVLIVPGLCGGSGWKLRWADHGARLFQRQDVMLATSIHGMLQRCANYEIAVRAGVESERLRLAHDLHDDLGARLLTLIHRSEGQPAQMARDALENLRLVVHGLAAGSLALEEALSRCREETADRCEAVGVDLVWNCVPDPLPRRMLPPLFQMNMSRVLREAVTNALRHAHPSQLWVCVDLNDEDWLVMTVGNDGSSLRPERWLPGLGMRGMQARTAVLGGKLDIRSDSDRVEVVFQVPLVGAPLWGVTPTVDSTETGRPVGSYG